jgi:putative ABC transport system substrate-binding protein
MRYLLLLVCVLVVAVPPAAEAQRVVPKVGVLFAGVPSRSPQLQGLYEGLASLGYAVGKNIDIELRSADGKFEHLPRLAAELLALKPDVVVASTTPSVVALKELTQTVPIVMVAVGDPLGSRFVTSLARPGGNITGPTIMNFELSRKRVELVKDTLPRADRLGVLLNPMNPQSVLALQEIQTAATALQLDLRSFPVRSPDELPTVLAGIMQMRPSALMVVPDSLTFSFRKPIIEFMIQNRLPGFFTYKEEVVDGGLLAFGVNLREEYRRTAVYVDKILKGSKPADLPVEQPTKFELVINPKTARTIGLAIPPSLLLRADQIVE